MINRRQRERVPIGNEVKIVIPDGGVIHTKACDISLDGIGIELKSNTDTGKEFDVFIGKVLDILIELPCLDQVNRLDARCVINSLGSREEGSRIGMRIVRLADEARMGLEHFIAQRLPGRS